MSALPAKKKTHDKPPRKPTHDAPRVEAFQQAPLDDEDVSPEEAEAMRRADRDFEEGRTSSWADVRQRLGLGGSA